MGIQKSLLQLSTFHGVCTSQTSKNYVLALSLDDNAAFSSNKKACIFCLGKVALISVESREYNPGLEHQSGPLCTVLLKQNTVYFATAGSREIVPSFFSQNELNIAPIIF
jgi:hypothetical protein